MKQTNFQVLYDNLLDGKETVSLNSRSVVMYFCTGKFLLHIEIQNILPHQEDQKLDQRLIIETAPEAADYGQPQSRSTVIVCICLYAVNVTRVQKDIGAD